jgi:hypothetical protein
MALLVVAGTLVNIRDVIGRDVEVLETGFEELLVEVALALLGDGLALLNDDELTRLDDGVTLLDNDRLARLDDGLALLDDRVALLDDRLALLDDGPLDAVFEVENPISEIVSVSVGESIAKKAIGIVNSE